VQDARWYVVQSHPRKETIVRGRVEDLGADVFLPTVAERRPGHRRASIGPLFPGYLFARFEFGAEYPRVRWTPGLVRVVMSGGTPLTVSEAMLSSVRELEKEGIRLLLRPVRWKPGARVRVNQGPFTGFEGQVAATLKGGDRVRILLELFRRQVALECDTSQLRGLAAAGSG